MCHVPDAKHIIINRLLQYPHEENESEEKENIDN